MATPTFDWIEAALLEKVVTLAHQRGQSPESIINEAITLYLEAQPLEKGHRADPLIGLFAGTNFAARSEDILQQEITAAGWTWKQPLS